MSAKKTGRRGDTTSAAVKAGNHYTTLVCQATQMPGWEIAGHRQAEEGCVSSTAEGRRREASLYDLWVKAAGPGVRLATPPMKVTATKTRSEHVVLRKDRNKMKERSGKGPTRTI